MVTLLKIDRQIADNNRNSGFIRGGDSTNHLGSFYSASSCVGFLRPRGEGVQGADEDS
jgi:hypothetical protein